MAARGRTIGAPPTSPRETVTDYRFDAPRKKIPPAGLAAQAGRTAAHRLGIRPPPAAGPALRCKRAADPLPVLIATTRKRALTEEEARWLITAEFDDYELRPLTDEDRRRKCAKSLGSLDRAGRSALRRLLRGYSRSSRRYASSQRLSAGRCAVSAGLFHPHVAAVAVRARDGNVTRA